MHFDEEFKWMQSYILKYLFAVIYNKILFCIYEVTLSTIKLQAKLSLSSAVNSLTDKTWRKLGSFKEVTIIPIKGIGLYEYTDWPEVTQPLYSNRIHVVYYVIHLILHFDQSHLQFVPHELFFLFILFRKSSIFFSIL